jgi:hypothetical protein
MSYYLGHTNASKRCAVRLALTLILNSSGVVMFSEDVTGKGRSWFVRIAMVSSEAPSLVSPRKPAPVDRITRACISITEAFPRSSVQRRSASLWKCSPRLIKSSGNMKAALCSELKHASVHMALTSKGEQKSLRRPRCMLCKRRSSPTYCQYTLL